MGVYCCTSEDKEEQHIVDCENEYKPQPCTRDNNCNEIYKTRPPCMYGYVRSPVITVGSVFLNKFYININLLFTSRIDDSKIGRCHNSHRAQKPEVYKPFLLKSLFF